VGENFVTVLELHPEHGVRKGFDNGSFEKNRVLFGLGQGELQVETDCDTRSCA
jgi:hypothetical protein